MVKGKDILIFLLLLDILWLCYFSPYDHVANRVGSIWTSMIVPTSVLRMDVRSCLVLRTVVDCFDINEKYTIFTADLESSSTVHTQIASASLVKASLDKRT